MDGPRIGAAAPHDVPLDGDLPLCGQPLQGLHQLGVADHRAVHHLDRRSLAQTDGAQLLRAGGVVHVSDVHRQGIVRVDRPGRRPRPPEPNLFLGGEHQIQVVGTGVQLLQYPQEHSAGDTVIQVRGNHFIPTQKYGGIIDRGVSNLDHPAGLLLVLRPDVHIAGVQLQLAEFRLLLRDDDPPHSVFEAHRGVQQLPGGDPAQGPHPEEPLLLDVGDDQAGGVHVGAQHHLGTAPPLPDDQVPQGIRRHLVGVGPGQGGNDLPHRALVPGGAMGSVEGLDQFKQFHVTTP